MTKLVQEALDEDKAKKFLANFNPNSITETSDKVKFLETIRSITTDQVEDVSAAYTEVLKLAGENISDYIYESQLGDISNPGKPVVPDPTKQDGTEFASDTQHASYKNAMKLAEDKMKEFIESAETETIDEKVFNEGVRQIIKMVSEKFSVNPVELERQFNTKYPFIEDKNSLMNQFKTAGQSAKSADELINFKAEDFNLSDHFGKIFENEEVSDEFQEKVQTIFETAVHSKIKSELSKIHEEVSSKVSAQKEEIKEELVNQIDGYLSYIVNEWTEENEIAIEDGLKNEIMEDFMNGLKTLFKENYIEIPEEKLDVVNELTAKNNTVVTELNKKIDENISLKKDILEYKKEMAINAIGNDLTTSQKEKFAEFAEDISANTDGDLIKKMGIIKENYFNAGSTNSKKTYIVETKDIDEIEDSNSDVIDADTSDNMRRYAESISSSSR